MCQFMTHSLIPLSSDLLRQWGLSHPLVIIDVLLVSRSDMCRLGHHLTPIMIDGVLGWVDLMT